MQPDPEKKYWLDDPRNVNKIVYGVYAVCALLGLADFVYHKHTHFDVDELVDVFEKLPGFYGFFGLLAFTGLVFSAKALRIILKRREDYYDQ
jgi:hypothetical protein